VELEVAAPIMSEYHKANAQSTVTSKNENVSNSLDDLKQTLKEGLLSFCTAAGLAALHLLIEEAITRLAGPKGKHNSQRQAYRHGHEDSSVAIAFLDGYDLNSLKRTT